MLTVKIVEGPRYDIKSRRYTDIITYRTDYIRFEWDGGYLQMQKTKWDKLPLKKKQLIYEKGQAS